MSVLYVALPVALLLGGGGLICCLWCIRRGQFEDLETPAVRMLLEDNAVSPETRSAHSAPPSGQHEN